LAAIAIEERIAGETVVLLGCIKNLGSSQITRTFEDTEFSVSEESSVFALEK
jgi:hypothetical protein